MATNPINEQPTSTCGCEGELCTNPTCDWPDDEPGPSDADFEEWLARQEEMQGGHKDSFYW